MQKLSIIVNQNLAGYFEIILRKKILKSIIYLIFTLGIKAKN